MVLKDGIIIKYKIGKVFYIGRYVKSLYLLLWWINKKEVDLLVVDSSIGDILF